MKENRIKNLDNFVKIAELVLDNLAKGRSVEIKASEANLEAFREGRMAGETLRGIVKHAGRPVGTYKETDLKQSKRNDYQREYMRRKREEERLKKNAEQQDQMPT